MLLVIKKDLHGCEIMANDRQIGTADEVYFDSSSWHVRYLVVDTGPWLWGRKVLVAPAALGAVNLDQKTVRVTLTRKQVQESPDIDTAMPVSLQAQRRLHEYYGWPMYWGIGGYGGIDGVPFEVYAEEDRKRDEQLAKADPNLRGSKEASGYSIETQDGQIGRLEDLVLNDEDWTIKYLIADSRSWLIHGKHVLVYPSWVEYMDWTQYRLGINISKEALQGAPEYDYGPITMEYEKELSKYYASLAK